MTEFVTVVADPPWQYRDKLRMDDTKRGAEDQYEHVMDLDEICRLATAPSYWPVHHSMVKCPDLRIMGHKIADNAVLWLWTTLPFFLNGNALAVANAWGFEAKTVFHWLKGDADETREELIRGPLGLGHYLRIDTEYCLVCTRGKAASMLMRHDVRDWWLVAPKTGHSRKPQAFFDLVETITPGPYLELFARERRPDWTCIGDEL